MIWVLIVLKFEDCHSLELIVARSRLTVVRCVTREERLEKFKRKTRTLRTLFALIEVNGPNGRKAYLGGNYTMQIFVVTLTGRTIKANIEGKVGILPDRLMFAGKELEDGQTPPHPSPSYGWLANGDTQSEQEHSIRSFEMNCHPLPQLDISLCSSGGHNSGKIGCEFIWPRLHNFHETGQPDPTIASDFLDEMSLICSVNGSTSPNGVPSPVRSRPLVDSTIRSSLVSAGSIFGKHYYDSVLRGGGLLFADQQLMAHDKTADLLRACASDDGATF
ncbi:hypothetical protein RHSIM_Rhsim06G0230100 [Rhododendron simsii]|uniref:Plant heme peroxidase family profile domain-containing protein n=1 Tax=Rhododendron simsii TaxID=118357 RepID=A0A834LJ51_RHOSS|nr:hypothetical protein RHSIM_Rhsim06G0230100 [Rhododendron simsii]